MRQAAFISSMVHGGGKRRGDIGPLSLLKKQQCQKCSLLLCRALMKHFYRFPRFGNRDPCFVALEEARRIVISENPQFVMVEGDAREVCDAAKSASRDEGDLLRVCRFD